MRRFGVVLAPSPKYLLQLLETRLDAVVYRLGFAPSVWAARQLVGHGHVLVDGQRVDIPSYGVKPGQSITLGEKMRRSRQMSLWSGRGGILPPPYLELDRDQLSEDRLIVEFYSR